MIILENAEYLGPNLSVHQGNIVVDKKIIVKILNSSETLPQGGERLDCSGLLVAPGFINCHTHNPASCFRGLFRDTPIENWCNENTAEGRRQIRAFEYVDSISGTQDMSVLLDFAYAELAAQGVTTIVETGQGDDSEEDLIHALDRSGLRGIIDVYEKAADFQLRETNRIHFCTHLPEEEDADHVELQKCRELAGKFPGLRMTHCLETKWRRVEILRRFGKSSPDVFKDYGLLDKQTVLFHLVHTNEQDLDLIQAAGAKAVLCPVSNMWSGTGIPNLSAILDKSIPAGLGTDFIYADFWDVMRTTYMLLKSLGEAAKYSAEDVYSLGTTGGAEVIGMKAKLGILQEGAYADMVFLDLSNPQIQPVIKKEPATFIHNLINHGNSALVKHVMGSGEWIKKDWKLIKIDLERTIAKYKEVIGKMY